MVELRQMNRWRLIRASRTESFMCPHVQHEIMFVFRLLEADMTCKLRLNSALKSQMPT